MILLRDVRDYIATLKIAEDEHCYTGVLDDKKDKSIGTYHLKSNRAPIVTIGGDVNRSYGVKGISFLVHWTHSPTDTEKAAIELYERIKETKNVTINKHNIKFIQMFHEEPVPVDRDSNGVFEYVIECLIYYEKE